MKRTAIIIALTAISFSAPLHAAPTANITNAIATTSQAAPQAHVTQVRSFFPRNRQIHSPRASRRLRSIRSNNPHQGAGD